MNLKTDLKAHFPHPKQLYLFYVMNDPSRPAKERAEARELLIVHNLKIAVKIAIKVAPMVTFVEFDDVLGWGYLALVKAVDGYNPGFGFGFYSYAKKVIRLNILRSVRDNENLVSVPNYVQSEVRRFKLAGKDPDGFAAFGSVALRRTTSAPEIVSVQDDLPDEDQLDLLRLAAGWIDDRHRVLLKQRFGLGGDPPMTLAAVAELQGVTRRAVGYRQQLAIKSLRLAIEHGPVLVG